MSYEKQSLLPDSLCFLILELQYMFITAQGTFLINFLEKPILQESWSKLLLHPLGWRPRNKRLGTADFSGQVIQCYYQIKLGNHTEKSKIMFLLQGSVSTLLSLFSKNSGVISIKLQLPGLSCISILLNRLLYEPLTSGK